MRILRLLPVVAALLAALAAAANAANAQATAAPLAARDLPRGTVVARADLTGGGPEEREAVIGSVTRRQVRTGEPLRAPAIAPPHLVSQGESVQLVWRGAGLELRMRGRAMGSAALGETVSVRVDTKRRYEGVVAGPGVVHIEPNGERR